MYRAFHDPGMDAPLIKRLRHLHLELDRMIASTYKWDDIDLEHGFHQTKQGIRFTISETARLELLDRLLELNHQRYAEEVAQGLHEKGAKRAKGKRGTAPQSALTGFE